MGHANLFYLTIINLILKPDTYIQGKKKSQTNIPPLIKAQKSTTKY